MAAFVVDASATLPWCFEDETTPWSENLLDRIKSGDSIVVPAHWLIEITNGMLTAVKRKRIAIEKVQAFLDAIAIFPIAIELPLTLMQMHEIVAAARKRNLTIYDAVYLELAKRRGLPLATLDIELREAAVAEGLLLL